MKLYRTEMKRSKREATQEGFKMEGVEFQFEILELELEQIVI